MPNFKLEGDACAGGGVPNPRPPGGGDGAPVAEENDSAGPQLTEVRHEALPALVAVLS